MRKRLYAGLAASLAASLLMACFSVWTLSRSRLECGGQSRRFGIARAQSPRPTKAAALAAALQTIEKHPRAAAQLVAAGHELGNHSYSHKRMVFKSPSFIRSEYERTDALIRAAGHRAPIHVRAPYCKKLIGLPWYFAKNDRVHVTFDVEPESDPELDADMNRLVASVVSSVRPGSIILLHPWYRGRERSRAAVPLIIKSLKERGYEFVTVSELLNVSRA